MSIDLPLAQRLDALRSPETGNAPAALLPATSSAGFSPSNDPAAGPEWDPDLWLMEILREATEELMEADLLPLVRANAIARLGSLFLRAMRAAELRYANKALKSQVAELEKRLAALELPGRAAQEKPHPASSEPRASAGHEEPHPAALDDALAAATSEGSLSLPGDAAPAALPPGRPTIPPPDVRLPGGQASAPPGTPAIVLAAARGSP